MNAEELIRLIDSADLANPDDRLMLADAMEDQGRAEEAALLRDLAKYVAHNDGVVCESTTWTVEMRDGTSYETIEFDHEPDEDEIVEAIDDWVRCGSWGEDGCEVDVGYTVKDPDGDEIDTSFHTVTIEPDHESLIAYATRHDDDRSCGNDPDDHDWTSEGEGGCSENPGVWSCGGTTMVFASHCRTCGLHRQEVHHGSQRNPGETDTTTYEMPASWCQEHQCEDCEECEECEE